MENALRNTETNFSTRPEIFGWGADLEPSKRPGVPKELNHENVMSEEHHLPIRVKQQPGPENFLTVERSSYPPVMGTVPSPGGISHGIRRFAFRFSEDALSHWFLLLAADRVNMVEGWIEDLGQGKKPMILPRMEFRTTDHLRRLAEQGPKSRADKVFVATAVIGLVGAGFLLSRSLIAKAGD